MIIKNLYNSSVKQFNPKYFTGKVVLRELYNVTNSSDHEVYYVEFNDGSLTTVHLHESEQILLPIYGKGIIGELPKKKRLADLSDIQNGDIQIKALNVGEIVSIPPNVLHFHGALPGYNFSHVAWRKLFDSGIENKKPESQTQTKWAFDLLSEQLADSDPVSISVHLEKLSSIINNAISNYLKQ